jgi:ferrous-iron efflux pump FieF
MTNESAPEAKISNTPQLQPSRALWAGAASLATVSFLIIVKATAFWYSGAASLMASLMDSVLDASVSFMMFMAIRYSLKPADDDHRYGHGKIEGIAALFQALVIFLAGLLLLNEAYKRFISPEPFENHLMAIFVMVLTIIASICLVKFQDSVLKNAPSLAVEADKAHYANDVIVNGGVIVTIGAIYFGGPIWLDPLFALLVGFYLGYTAYIIGKRALDMLLDRELPDDIRHNMKAIILTQDQVLGLHDLRTYQSGMRIFISFDLEVSEDLSLRDAHDIARNVELKLMASYPNAEVMIHVDPQGDTHDERHNSRSPK